MTARLVLLAGEPEYLAHETMPPLAAELAAELGLDLEVRIPDVIEDEPKFPTSTFGDLTVLADAALLIIYTRFRVLADADMNALQAYLDRRAPLIGLRTSSHAFHFPEPSLWHHWNEWFGASVLGSPWISHHGHSSSTDVEVLPNTPPALTDGLPPDFHVRSWLYHTRLAGWARPIMIGRPVEPELPPTLGPVAWYGTPEGRRTFFTTLGHPEDLVQVPVRRLLLNASRWALAEAPVATERDHSNQERGIRT